MEQPQTKTGLPSNAYRELAPGEVYKPVMPADKIIPEVTPWSVMWGLVMAVIFSAAAAYSGLKIGQVLEAAIPISIIAVGASTAFKRKNSLGQNVIIQSIGASSGVIVAGAIFTIPALYILNLDVNFWQIFFASLLGGFLGILFLIPFRRYFVKDMHGKFPFPEATATTEILITGEKGGAQAGTLILAGLIGGVYDFMFSALKLWDEVFTSRVIPFGAELADKAKMVFQLNVSSMIFGFGYLVGLKFSTIIAVGSLLSWFVFVPLINSIGEVVAGGMGAINPFAALPPEAIFTEYVRPIGIGAIAMAGIIGILKSSRVIGTAFKLAFGGLFGGSQMDTSAHEERTDKDIKMTFILIFSLLTMVMIFVFLLSGVDVTPWQAVVAFLTVTIIAFLFTTVAANAIAIVGTNPVSGMTLMTLILSSFVLVQAGLKGETGMISALIIGGIVCTALSMAGGFITDLKIGYWLGSTPKKQESWKFLGTLVSAATVGAVIFILNEAYGFTYTEATPDPLVAPQANAMAAVIQPLMSEAEINWMLYIVGAVIALLLNFIGISPLAFALGMYLPLHLNTPLLVGGLLSHFIKKSSKDEKLVQARNQKGTLIASGFIAGAAIFGVIGALLKFFNFDLDINPWSEGSHGPEILAMIMFAAIIIFFARFAMSAKPEE
ncbi:MAG: OPT family oligopeptide transporter [Candidatus Kapaibacterium sp.]